jgi:hypothetical protein
LAEATRAYQFILNQHFKSITGAAGVAQAIQNGMDVALKRIHDTTFLAVSTSDGNDDRSFMVERLNVVDTGIVPNSSEITIHDVRRQIASLQFKQEGIDDYNDKIGPAPKF